MSSWRFLPVVVCLFLTACSGSASKESVAPAPPQNDRVTALADSVLARGETALTELSDAELRDLVTLRRAPDEECDDP